MTTCTFSLTDGASSGPANAPVFAICICTIFPASRSRSSRAVIGRSKTERCWMNTRRPSTSHRRKIARLSGSFIAWRSSGAEPVELTHDHGTHEVSMAPDGRHFLDTYSTAIKPPQQRLYNADGSLVATLEENKVPELEKYHLQPIEFFTVPGADGTPLDAAMIKPPGFDPARQISGDCASLWRAARAGGAGRVAGFEPLVA